VSSDLFSSFLGVSQIQTTEKSRGGKFAKFGDEVFFVKAVFDMVYFAETEYTNYALMVIHDYRDKITISHFDLHPNLVFTLRAVLRGTAQYHAELSLYTLLCILLLSLLEYHTAMIDY